MPRSSGQKTHVSAEFQEQRAHAGAQQHLRKSAQLFPPRKRRCLGAPRVAKLFPNAVVDNRLAVGPTKPQWIFRKLTKTQSGLTATSVLFLVRRQPLQH